MDVLWIINRALELIKPRLNERGIEFTVVGAADARVTFKATRRARSSDYEFSRTLPAEDIQHLGAEVLAESLCKQALNALASLEVE